MVATLHIRNVPDDVVETLKARAHREGRSLNAEVVLALTAAAPRRTLDEIIEDVKKLAATIPNPPTVEEVVDSIHQAREERTRRVLGIADDE
jgi:antitoxin FitA